MELRLLRYFLTVAKEQSFTKAAEQLHITQPTLSRQMAAFEEELGVILFIRSGKKISLTEEGILLKRRALEILNLEERTLEELKGKEDVVEGNITIGCGEFAAVETLAEICKTYKEKYPLVQIVLHTATADAVYEMMNKGLVDIALFMEPVDTEGLDYIRITDCDHWCVGMRPDDPLAEKEFIKKEDLIGKGLSNEQADLALNASRTFNDKAEEFRKAGNDTMADLYALVGSAATREVGPEELAAIAASGILNTPQGKEAIDEIIDAMTGLMGAVGNTFGGINEVLSFFTDWKNKKNK